MYDFFFICLLSLNVDKVGYNNFIVGNQKIKHYSEGLVFRHYLYYYVLTNNLHNNYRCSSPLTYKIIK